MPGSSYEDLTRRFLREMFPQLQLHERRRPDFLKYTTGRNLELDLWDEGRRLAIEVQGPQHFRAVEGMATPEQSQDQRERDTFKRQRCTEAGVTLLEFDIYTLAMESRFYLRYLELCSQMGVPAMGRQAFQLRPEIRDIVRQASRLATSSKPARKRRRCRKPGLWPMLQRRFF